MVRWVFRIAVALIISLFLSYSVHAGPKGDLECPQTNYYNYSGYVWNILDKLAVAEAKQTCYDIFPERPCLFRFFKLGIGMYKVECVPRWVVGFRDKP